MRNIKSVIVKPVITEKSMTMAAAGWYTFAVTVSVEKPRIAAEIARIYKVTVKEVRTIHKKGKTRRVGRRSMQVTGSDTKKAMVKLAAGQSIPVFEVTQQGETK
jgi:large subunit ribosomal protein L23